MKSVALLLVSLVRVESLESLLRFRSRACLSAFDVREQGSEGRGAKGSRNAGGRRTSRRTSEGACASGWPPRRRAPDSPHFVREASSLTMRS